MGHSRAVARFRPPSPPSLFLDLISWVHMARTYKRVGGRFALPGPRFLFLEGQEGGEGKKKTRPMESKGGRMM